MSTNTNIIVILGADDPEMTTIENLCRSADIPTVYATVGGKRCHPGNAYKADGVSGPGLDGAETVVLVECDLPGWFQGDPAPEVIRVDHHRPGDPGYGRPPVNYWLASSIGQMYEMLWPHPVDVPRLDRTPVGLLLVAAADHCLAAAYRGECPGVDPNTLTEWRVKARAAHQGRSVESLMADMNRAMARLSEGPEVLGLVDLRGENWPELPEAAIRLGVAYMTTVTDPDGRQKEILGGHTTPSQVQGWMDTRKAEGREVYGDPARGFAGAYLQ